MLDIKLIRENPSMIRDNLNKRGNKEKIKLLDQVIELDTKLRDLIIINDKLKHQRNTISKEIAELKKKGKVILLNPGSPSMGKNVQSAGIINITESKCEIKIINIENGKVILGSGLE